MLIYNNKYILINHFNAYCMLWGKNEPRAVFFFFGKLWAREFSTPNLILIYISQARGYKLYSVQLAAPSGRYDNIKWNEY